MSKDKKVNYMLKTCLGKKVYRTQEFALKMAKELERKFGVKHYVYWCPICLNYHCTTHKHNKARNYIESEE